MLYICIYFSQSNSLGFRVTDLNSRDDSRVVANVDGRTDVRVEFCKNVGSYGPYSIHIE